VDQEIANLSAGEKALEAGRQIDNSAKTVANETAATSFRCAKSRLVSAALEAARQIDNSAKTVVNETAATSFRCAKSRLVSAAPRVERRTATASDNASDNCS
jgi:hypothetical protein